MLVDFLARKQVIIDRHRSFLAGVPQGYHRVWPLLFLCLIADLSASVQSESVIMYSTISFVTRCAKAIMTL